MVSTLTNTENLSSGAPPTADSVLEPAEVELVQKLWDQCAARGGSVETEGKANITMALLRLEKVWEAIEIHPSILKGQTLGARHRNLGSLVDTFSACHPLSVEVFLPTRGALCQAFLLAKLNFCRFLGYLANELLDDHCSAMRGLFIEIERVRTSAVCTIIAENLLRNIASDPNLPREMRRRGTWVLLQMWEDRTGSVVPVFFPVLESAWQAKTQVTVAYGTLVGVGEILSMLSEGCDPKFLECFAQDNISDEAELALQEFVLNFSYEQIQQIQEYMAESDATSVDASQAARILDIPLSDLHVQTSTCEEMLFTFRARQSMANHRRALNLPGPQHTAEECLMVYLLEQAGDVESKDRS